MGIDYWGGPQVGDPPWSYPYISPSPILYGTQVGDPPGCSTHIYYPPTPTPTPTHTHPHLEKKYTPLSERK